MIWVLGVVILLLVLDIARMRGRLGAIAVLPASDEPMAPDHEIIAAPGATVDDATRRAASAWARAHALAIVDLIPRDLPAIRAMSLVQLVDPARYRDDRLGPGRTAGHAILVSREIASRAEITPPHDEVEFVRLAARLKHFGRADLAVASAERARPSNLRHRLAVLRVVLGPTTPIALVVQPVFWAVMALGVWRAPIWGLAAVILWHLQPLAVIAGTSLRSRGLGIVTLLRLPIELWILLRTVLGDRSSIRPDLALARRGEYARLVDGGTARFFEPRREVCPICEGRDLSVHLRNSDLLQHKPGTFTLERCGSCRHVFQNPRLSLAGLDFYYKDFYDGLGEAGMEMLFGFGAQPYLARARMMREITTPASWLDVGAGHGHFCAAVRGELPGTRFDGLDLSDSIDEAKRRGWVDNAYRGMFPDVAPELAGRYDAISMSHYLEHTLDPRREIAAARTALAPAGCLLIEVPDPEFPLGRVLRRLWLPWFQPQHLHLLSVTNLERLLREQGFTPITWHRGRAHQRVDFLFAVWLALGRLAPPSRLPWRWRGRVAGAWHVLVWTLGAPLLLAGTIIDNVAGPLIQRGRISNTYRVVARRDPEPKDS